MGTPVYLRSANEKHFADGRITSVNGSQFTVQVLGGDLVYTEDVKIYREPDYNNKTLLARAELSIVQPLRHIRFGHADRPGRAPRRRGASGRLSFQLRARLLGAALRVEANPPPSPLAEPDRYGGSASCPGASVQKDQALHQRHSHSGFYRLKAQATEADVEPYRRR